MVIQNSSNGIISLCGIRKSYGDNLVLENISFEIQKGSFVSIMGPTGCGKSTLLRMLAPKRKTYPDGGYIHHDFKKISYIRQNASKSLHPWRTCFDYIGYPLEIHDIDMKTILKSVLEIVKELGLPILGIHPHKQKNPKVLEIVKELGLPIPLEQRTHECSGGQSQFVALACALVNHPDIVIMDEPFSAIDPESRILIQKRLSNISQKMGVTVILVTHDYDEAVFLSDKIIIFSEKPSKVLTEIPVNLPRPRNYSVLGTEEFLKIRKKVWESYPRDSK